MKRTLIITFLTVFCLTACGGGGGSPSTVTGGGGGNGGGGSGGGGGSVTGGGNGGGGSGGGNQNTMKKDDKPKPTQNQLAQSGIDFTRQGTASSHANALTKIRERRKDDGDSFFNAPTGTPDIAVAAVDTNAEAAWRQGWTGQGVKVAIVDDGSNRFTGIGTHANATAAIATQIAPEAEFNVESINLRSSGQTITAITDLNAKALSAYANLISTFSDGRVESQVSIVNSSFAVDPFRDLTSPGSMDLSAYVDEYMKGEVFEKVHGAAAKSDTYPEDMLFVFSAGNSGNKCIERVLDKCRIQAAALLKLRETDTNAGDRVILVGALADGSKTLADYSFTAGEMKNDFIVAHDDVWASGDAAGTSFAAPRVTGAAALVRHKFPNLTGPQLKQVLLQTAEDLGAPGVDAVFGYGKLNILGALSPIDGLTR